MASRSHKLGIARQQSDTTKLSSSSLRFSSPGYVKAAADGEDEIDDKKLGTRSLSLSGMDVKHLRSHAASKATHSLESDSPLRRFSTAKESIAHVFGLLKERLLESSDFVIEVHQGSECKPLTALIERTEKIREVLERDHMKVAFFGRTSNGKSTVINAILRERVLPAGIGHTTNCFCSVAGVDDAEGYLISPNSQEKQNVKVRVGVSTGAES